MKILAVDIGNSSICIGCVTDHQVDFCERMNADRRKTELEYAVLCKTVLDLHSIPVDSLDGAVISSVVPPLTDLLAIAVKKLTGLDTLIISPGIKTGILSLAPNVGADLVVGAAAAVYEYGAPAIVIDMGTATTITAVDGKCRFLGGVIYPGVQIALQSLETGAAQLPHIELKAPAKTIHMDTIGSMQAGAVYGSAGAIDGLLDRMLAEMEKPAAIIATGGLASMIIPHCRHQITLDEHLLLKGLDVLYHKNNAENKS